MICWSLVSLLLVCFAHFTVSNTKQEETCSVKGFKAEKTDLQSCEEKCGQRGYKTVSVETKKVCKKEVLITGYGCSLKKYLKSIENVTAENITKTSAAISLKVPEYLGKVKYQYTCLATDLQVHVPPFQTSSSKYGEVEETSFSLDNLLKGQEYICKVRAVSYLGKSKHGNVTFTTLEDVPETSPQRISIIFKTRSSFYVEWQPPLYRNGKITGYNIVVRYNGSEEQKIKEEEVSGDNTSFLMSSEFLEKLDTQFLTVGVAAKNNVGKSPYRYQKIFLPPYDDYELEDCIENPECREDCMGSDERVAFMQVAGHYTEPCLRKHMVGQCIPEKKTEIRK